NREGEPRKPRRHFVQRLRHRRRFARLDRADSLLPPRFGRRTLALAPSLPRLFAPARVVPKTARPVGRLAQIRADAAGRAVRLRCAARPHAASTSHSASQSPDLDRLSPAASATIASAFLTAASKYLAADSRTWECRRTWGRYRCVASSRNARHSSTVSPEASGGAERIACTASTS